MTLGTPQPRHAQERESCGALCPRTPPWRLCLFRVFFLHDSHTSQGTEGRDSDDYSFPLLPRGINGPQDLTNNIFFPPTLTKLDGKLKASKLLSSSLCRGLTVWKGTSHTELPVC